MNLNHINMSHYKEAFLPITESSSFLSILTLIRVILVLMSRAGFVLIQFASVPTENFYDLLLQNVVELSVSLTSYGLLGSLLSFGNHSYKGILGYGPWAYTTLNSDNIVLGFCAVLVGSSVITTFLSSRLHFLGCAFLAFIYAGFFQPLLMHWIWHKDGWMNNMKLGNTSVEITDHAGALVIHVSSSCVGLIGSAFLGRRLLRLNYIDDCSLGAETPSTILMGYIFIALGLIGLSLPMKASSFLNCNYISAVLINDFLSLAGGLLAAIIFEFILCRDTFNYWIILRCIQGCVSALIIISSSIDVISSPPLSFGVTFILTIFLNLSSKFIYKSSLEDYCNILTVHLQSGIWSVLLQPFIASLNTFQQINLIKFSWHVICTVTVISFTVLFFSSVFLLLCCTGFLRNKIEDNCHRRSANLFKNFQARPLHRFFFLSKSDVMLEPGSSGKIASESSLPDPEITYVEDEVPARLKKSIFTEKAITLEQSNSAEIKKSPGGNNSTKGKRKTKNIYTMKNVPITRQSDSVLNCGDSGDFNKIYKLEDLIKQKSKTLSGGKTKTKNKLTKRMSQHKINKSKQFGSLSKNKLVKKRMINKSKTSHPVTIPVSQNLITVDKRFKEELFSTTKIQ